MFYKCFTHVLHMFYKCFTNVLQMFYFFTNVLQMFYKCFTNVLHMFYKCFTMFYKCFTNVLQMFYKCFTNVLRTVLNFSFVLQMFYVRASCVAGSDSESLEGALSPELWAQGEEAPPPWARSSWESKREVAPLPPGLEALSHELGALNLPRPPPHESNTCRPYEHTLGNMRGTICDTSIKHFRLHPPQTSQMHETSKNTWWNIEQVCSEFVTHP